MRGLPVLQRDFAAGIMDAGAAPAVIRADGLSAARRLQVYRNNVLASLTDVLEAIHPVVAKLVGDGFFQYAAHEFIHRNPSRSGDLHDFGSTFSGFLQEFPPAQQLPYLGDVARLEWLYHEVYHAAEQAPLDFEALARVPPDRYEDLCFDLHPAVRLLHSPYPLLRIWQTNQDDYDGDQQVSLDAGATRLLIVRREEVEFHELPQGEFVLLEHLATGDRLATAAAAAAATDDGFDLDTSLTRQVSNQVLADFHLN